MASSANARGSAVMALQKEFKELVETPVEGFKVTLVDESNLFIWDVTIFGPPQTLYEGGYFKVDLSIYHSKFRLAYLFLRTIHTSPLQCDSLIQCFIRIFSKMVMYAYPYFIHLEKICSVMNTHQSSGIPPSALGR